MDPLPADFLAEPREGITVDRVDFEKHSLPEYKDYYAVVIDNVLSPEACQQLLEAAEKTSNGEWERAMVNIGGGHQTMITDIRSCGRIIWDAREVVARIWNRIAHLVPEMAIVQIMRFVTGPGPAKRGEVWKLTRLNERMRFLKYEGGEYFRRKSSLMRISSAAADH